MVWGLGFWGLGFGIEGLGLRFGGSYVVVCPMGPQFVEAPYAY